MAVFIEKTTLFVNLRIGEKGIDSCLRSTISRPVENDKHKNQRLPREIGKNVI